ncbi:hypothetical protein RB195_018902 [Necator americanus]|uniref:Uncharacterized protein n=1 Tax=Necator americanus TaxID=51031 RepID=A0ABR1CDJ6_NECAM
MTALRTSDGTTTEKGDGESHHSSATMSTWRLTIWVKVDMSFQSATLEDAMRGLEWDNMDRKADDRHLHHLRFDDIVLITSSIDHERRMLAEFDET